MDPRNHVLGAGGGRMRRRKEHFGSHSWAWADLPSVDIFTVIL